MSGDLVESTLAFLTAGRAAWPGVAASNDRLIEALGGRETEVRCATDLFLAVAALAGDPHALRTLDALLTEVAPVLRRVILDHEISDVTQELQARMVLGRNRAPPTLATFAGKGPLRAWVRVALLRAGLDRRRKPDDTALDEIAWLAHGGEPTDPTVDAMRRSAGPTVRVAFEAALARLTPRERLLLRQHLLDGLAPPELATIYGVHRVTAFRWLAAIRQQVLADVRTTVERELKLDTNALDSLMRDMRASVVPTVERMLLATPEPVPS